MKNNKKCKNEKGFSILAVILVIVAVIVVIGIWALSGQTNTSSNGSNADDLKASAILNDSNNIKIAYDSLSIKGVDKTKITFIPNVASTNNIPNILDPTDGALYPKVPASTLKDNAASPEGIWVYNKNYKVQNIPGLTYAYAIILGGIKDNVCKRINYTIYGSEVLPYMVLNTPMMNFFPGVTPEEPTVKFSSAIMLVANTPVSIAGWRSGCVTTYRTRPDNNLYFRHLDYHTDVI